MRKRALRLSIGGFALLVLAVVVNTLVVDNQTKAASAKGGTVVRLKGGDLHVKFDGDPDQPTLLLIHGWTASLNWWNRATPELAKHFHVIRVDLLGHGGSEKPHDGYSIKNQAALIEQLLAQQRVHKLTVVGHSMGGLVATEIAADHPEMVKKLVVIDSPPVASGRYFKPSLDLKLSVMPLIGEIGKTFAPDSKFRDGMKQSFAKGVVPPKIFLDDLKGMTYSAYKKTYLESKRYLEERSLPQRLKTLKKPLLVIWGDDDDLISCDAAAEFKVVDGVEIKEIPNAGHSPMFEAPARTDKLIEDFVGI